LFSLNIASGFQNISLGPINPFMDLFKLNNPASVESAAEAPFESDNYLPALIALNGI
jgi:hypothetical protein